MASPNPFGNPKAPTFIPSCSASACKGTPVPFSPNYVRRNLFSLGVGAAAPDSRLATPKRPRTNTSPTAPVAPLDWGMEYVKFMTATGDGQWTNQFRLNAFGTMMAKLEERQQNTISALKETVSYLLGEIVTLKSQVAALDSVVDIVSPVPVFVPAPVTPSQAPAPPPSRPIPPPPPPPPPAAPSWATVTRKGKKKAAVPPIVMTAAGPVESFHHKRAPVESYPQYLARMSRSLNPAPAPKKQQQQLQQNTSPL